MKDFNKKESVSKKLGDKIERIGEKIYKEGNKLEHSEDDKRKAKTNDVWPNKNKK